MSGAFKGFVEGMTELVDANPAEAALFAAAQPLLADLLRSNRWLPEAFTQPHATRYAQYLLHCDPLERFSIVSFVWGPGQQTPIHDHTVWGLLGILRGSEVSQRFIEADGVLHRTGGLQRLEAGEIDLVSPTIGDIHQVRNGQTNRSSVSIHVYGGNIGAISRHAFTCDGSRKTFVSEYTSPAEAAAGLSKRRLLA